MIPPGKKFDKGQTKLKSCVASLFCNKKSISHGRVIYSETQADVGEMERTADKH
jgi:hypothetical protein